MVGAIFLTDQGFWKRMEAMDTGVAQRDASARGRLLAWKHLYRWHQTIPLV